MKTLMLVLGLILLPLHQYVYAQEWSAEQKDVWRTVETMWDLEAKGDVEGLLAYCDDGLTIWLQGAPLPSDKAAFRKWASYDSKHEQTPVQELRPVAITVFPTFAVVHYYVIGITVSVATGRPETGFLKATDVFRKKGDKWLWVSGHNTSER
jgi:hypothetical protein